MSLGPVTGPCVTAHALGIQSFQWGFACRQLIESLAKATESDLPSPEVRLTPHGSDPILQSRGWFF